MRQSNYDQLAAMVPQIADMALGDLIAGVIPAYMIVVPHHDFRGALSALIRDAFIEVGFSINRATHSEIVGDEFVVHITPVSARAGRGRSFNRVYVPDLDALSASQKKTMTDHVSLQLATLQSLGGSVVQY